MEFQNGLNVAEGLFQHSIYCEVRRLFIPVHPIVAHIMIAVAESTDPPVKVSVKYRRRVNTALLIIYT